MSEDEYFIDPYIPYKGHVQRMQSAAGALQKSQTQLYGNDLQNLTNSTNLHLRRLLTNLTKKDPCYAYGIQHWHPHKDQDTKPAEHKARTDAVKPQWTKSGVMFNSCDNIKSLSCDDIDTHGTAWNYCSFCREADGHKSNCKAPPISAKSRDKIRKAWTLRDIRLNYEVPIPSATKKPEVKSPEAKAEVVYKVLIKTGNCADAGTNITVFLTLSGIKDRIVKHPLTKSQGSSNFSLGRGTKEVFYLRAPDLGELKTLVVEHNGTLKKQGWFLDSIEVTKVSERKMWEFKCNRWLSMWEDDYELKRILRAKELENRVTDYNVCVLTGSHKEAGTEANVFISFYGKNGSTSRLQLKQDNLFERGQTSEFNLQVNDVGPLRKIRIEHDGRGDTPQSWYLERVLVSDVTRNEKFVFICNDWLQEDEDGEDHSFRHLLPRPYTKDLLLELRKNTKYTVTTTTGKMKSAGTNARVYIVIYGSNKKKTSELLLSGSTTSDPFESGKTDTFIVNGKDVGPIKHMDIYHDNTGPTPGWFLDKVCVERKLQLPEILERLQKKDDFGQLPDGVKFENLKESFVKVFNNLYEKVVLKKEKISKQMDNSSDSSSSDSDEEKGMSIFGKKSSVNKKQTAAADKKKKKQKELKKTSLKKKPNFKARSSSSSSDDDSDNVQRPDVDIEQADIKFPIMEVIDFVCEQWLAKDEADKKTERRLFPHKRHLREEIASVPKC